MGNIGTPQQERARGTQPFREAPPELRGCHPRGCGG